MNNPASTESTSAPVAVASDERLTLEREHAALTALRVEYKCYLLILLMPGGLLFGYGLNSHYAAEPSAYASFALVLGLAVLAGAGTFYARYRGQDPAWGALSIVTLLFLDLFPDRHARRLDELDRQLTGKAGNRVVTQRQQLAFGLPIVSYLAPLGLLYAILSLRDARLRKESPLRAILLTLWAGGMTLWLLFGLASNLQPYLHAETTLVGRQVLVRLPRGWQEDASLRNDPAIDVAVSAPWRKLHLTIAVVPKSAVTDVPIAQFTAGLLTYVRRSLGEANAPAVPIELSVAGHRRNSYEVQGTRDGRTHVTHRVTCWETDRAYYCVNAWTEARDPAEGLAELQQVTDTIRSLGD